MYNMNFVGGGLSTTSSSKPKLAIPLTKMTKGSYQPFLDPEFGKYRTLHGLIPNSVILVNIFQMSQTFDKFKETNIAQLPPGERLELIKIEEGNCRRKFTRDLNKVINWDKIKELEREAEAARKLKKKDDNIKIKDKKTEHSSRSPDVVIISKAPKNPKSSRKKNPSPPPVIIGATHGGVKQPLNEKEMRRKMREADRERQRALGFYVANEEVPEKKKRKAEDDHKDSSKSRKRLKEDVKSSKPRQNGHSSTPQNSKYPNDVLDSIKARPINPNYVIPKVSKDRELQTRERKEALEDYLRKHEKKEKKTIPLDQVVVENPLHKWDSSSDSEDEEKKVVEEDRPASQPTLAQQMNSDVYDYFRKYLGMPGEVVIGKSTNILLSNPLSLDEDEKLRQYFESTTADNIARKIAWWTKRDAKSFPHPVDFPELEEDSYSEQSENDEDVTGNVTDTDEEGSGDEEKDKVKPGTSKMDPRRKRQHFGEALLDSVLSPPPKQSYIIKDGVKMTMLNPKPGSNCEKESSQVFCNICREVCKGLSKLAKHLRGSKHQENLLKLSFKLASKEEKVAAKKIDFEKLKSDRRMMRKKMRKVARKTIDTSGLSKPCYADSGCFSAWEVQRDEVTHDYEMKNGDEVKDGVEEWGENTIITLS